MVANAEGVLTRIEPAGQYAAKQAGFDWHLGSTVTREELTKVANWMALALMRVLTQKFTHDDLKNIFLTDPIEDWGQIDGILFSGGVAEYVYHREAQDFGEQGAGVLAVALGRVAEATPAREMTTTELVAALTRRRRPSIPFSPPAAGSTGSP